MRNGVSVLYGRTAVKIDSADRKVTTDDGKVLSYDSLLIAAGSSPFVPALQGLDTVTRKYGFMTLDDALALETAVTEDTRVLIIGAGLIGLKCAEGLYEKAGSIIVCDLAGRILSSILDDECASLVKRHLEEKGISFLLNDSVLSFENGRAFMKSGKTQDFDVLVLAVGVRPNISLIKDIGGDTGRGITVSSRMETSVKHIYAAGDCAEAYDISSGERKVMAVLPSASIGGYTAGVNMAGGDARFDTALPMNSIGFFGYHIMTAGSYEGELYEERTSEGIKRLFIKDGVLKGFMLLGMSERAGILTSLIREKTPLKEIDFDLMKKGATTAALTGDMRKDRFGKAV
jgi:NAD(P)H-nitrite reductase large subunit